MNMSENDPDATATIPRTSINTSTASDPAETAAVNRQEIKAKLEEDKPKKATIRLKPVVVEGVETVTVPLPMQAPRIVTTTAAVSSPAPAPTTSQATAVPKFASTEDETVKIQKPRSVNASAPVPGVKQTIKLRPSSTTPAPISDSESNAAIIPQAPPPAAPQAPQPPVAGGSEAKRTIRLVPKKSDATSGADNVSPTAKPSAPTVKLEEPPTPTPAPAEPVRSAVTVKLPSADSGADAAAPKRTLKLKSSRAPEASAAPSAPPPMAPPVATMPNSPATAASATDSEMPAIAVHGISQENAQQYSTSGKQEPSIIFTIAACVAFFVMAYFTWMLVGQYCSNYTDSKISVPGLSGNVK